MQRDLDRSSAASETSRGGESTKRTYLKRTRMEKTSETASHVTDSVRVELTEQPTLITRPRTPTVLSHPSPLKMGRNPIRPTTTAPLSPRASRAPVPPVAADCLTSFPSPIRGISPDIGVGGRVADDRGGGGGGTTSEDEGHTHVTTLVTVPTMVHSATLPSLSPPVVTPPTKTTATASPPSYYLGGPHRVFSVDPIHIMPSAPKLPTEYHQQQPVVETEEERPSSIRIRRDDYRLSSVLGDTRRHQVGGLPAPPPLPRSVYAPQRYGSRPEYEPRYDTDEEPSQPAPRPRPHPRTRSHSGGGGGRRTHPPPLPTLPSSNYYNTYESAVERIRHSLDAKDESQIPNYDEWTEEAQSTARQRFIDKFLVLKHNYSFVTLPTEEMTLKDCHRQYLSHVRHITIHTNSMYYKIFVIILFGGIELFARHHGVDLDGFAKFQIRTINRYNQVLLELGEKWYSPNGAEMAVETRIVGLALIQAAIFYAGRVIERKFGVSAETVHSMIDAHVTGGPPPPSSDAPVGAGGGGTSTTTRDAQGLPFAPGTEEAIRNLDRAAPGTVPPPSSGGGGGTFDLGGILSGLMGGGAKSGGGEGPDLSGIMQTAMSFLAPQPSSARGASGPTTPLPPRVSPHIPPSPVCTNRSSGGAPPRSSPPRRRSPNFPSPSTTAPATTMDV